MNNKTDYSDMSVSSIFFKYSPGSNHLKCRLKQYHLTILYLSRKRIIFLFSFSFSYNKNLRKYAYFFIVPVDMLSPFLSSTLVCYHGYKITPSQILCL